MRSRRAVPMSSGAGTSRLSARGSALLLAVPLGLSLSLGSCATAETESDDALAAAVRAEAPTEVRTYRFYVANESSDLVSRIAFTPGEGAVVENEIPVGIMPGDIDGAHGLTVSPRGDRFYVTIAHGQPFGTVWQFATGADTLVARETLGLFPATMGITPDGQLLATVNFNLHGDMVPSDVSVVYTPTMTEVARVTTCLMPHGSRMNAGGTRNYSTCMHSDQLVELDLSTFEVSARFDLTPGSEGPLALLPAGEGRDHFRHGGGDAIRHDEPAPRRDTVQQRVTREDLIRRTGGDEGGEPREWRMRMAGGGGDPVCKPTWAEPGTGPRADRFVYVACNGNREVLEIDVIEWEVTRRFRTGQAPYNLDISPDGRILVATLKGEQKVAVVDLDSGEEVARIDASQPITHGVVVSPDGRYAFVTNEAVGSTPGTVDVIDLRTLELVETVEVAHQPGGIDFWRMDDGGRMEEGGGR